MKTIPFLQKNVWKRASFHPVLTLLFLALFFVSSTSISHGRRGKVKVNTTATTPWAIMLTSKGPVVVKLHEEYVPVTVKHFIKLATGKVAWKDPHTSKKRVNQPFYDGLQFFRVIPNYLIQTGCSLNNGTQGPGFFVKDEYHPKLTHKGAGVVGLANAGPNTGGSQFYITLRSTPWLNFRTLRGKFCTNFKLPFRCRSNRDCKRYAKQYSSASSGTPTCKAKMLRKGHTIFGQVVYGMKTLRQSAEAMTKTMSKRDTFQILRIHIRRGRSWKRSWLRLPAAVFMPSSTSPKKK